MRSHSLTGWSLWAAALPATVNAINLISELSFGYGDRLAPEGAGAIPNFAIQGTPQIPELLSNKLILTPYGVANQRSAIWADQPLQHEEWVADIDFRCSGAPDRPSGNLNIWLTRDGSTSVGQGSVYTVGKFDGLVLVIDTTPSSGKGMIRGFLNDGTKDFNAQRPDGLSFGHCEYPYRNRGAPSQIKLRYTRGGGLTVQKDGQDCFVGDKISLPTGYKFGVTAASAENPDSFELFKMVVMAESTDGYRHEQPAAAIHAQNNDNNQPPKWASGGGGGGNGGFEDDIPDEAADKITSSAAQFADLHNRIQGVNNHLSTFYRLSAQQDIVGEKRHEEMSKQLSDLNTFLSKLDRIPELERRIDDLDRDMKNLLREMGSKLGSMEHSVKTHVTGGLAGHADSLAQSLKPQGHGKLIFVVVLGQVCLVGAYVIYKRRKSASPKKYL